MTLRRPRSGTARFGLLVVALVQVLATAALPFLHTHRASAPIEVIGSDESGQDRSAAPHDESTCTVCRTLATAAAAMLAPSLADAVTVPMAAVPAGDDPAVPSARFASPQSRAPPRA